MFHFAARLESLCGREENRSRAPVQSYFLGDIQANVTEEEECRLHHFWCRLFRFRISFQGDVSFTAKKDTQIRFDAMKHDVIM